MSGAHLLPMWDCTQSLPILGTKNKTVRAWLPKADKQACRWPETKSSPTIYIIILYFMQNFSIILHVFVANWGYSYHISLCQNFSYILHVFVTYWGWYLLNALILRKSLINQLQNKTWKVNLLIKITLCRLL